MKLSVIVCVFNERETILELLNRVQQADLGAGWEREVIVVDNHSTDGTRELLEDYNSAPRSDLTVIFQTQNLGKGNSVRAAIPLCSGDFCITQDADLEYHPRHFGRMLRYANEHGLDVVYGSRVLGGQRYHSYAVNYWAVRVLTALTNVLFGVSFTDVATNYKLMRTSVLKSLHLTCSGFDLDFELSNKLALATRKIGEVPIDFEPRTFAQGKKIRARDGMRAFLVILRDRFVPGAWH